MKKNLLVAAVLTTFAAVSFATTPATPASKPAHKAKHAHPEKKHAAPATSAPMTK